jgi:hypothetical protein
MAKTIFTDQTVLAPDYFNSIQNLRFVEIPNQDGEYNLITANDFDWIPWNNRYLSKTEGGLVGGQKIFTKSPLYNGVGNFATAEIAITSINSVLKSNRIYSDRTLETQVSDSTINIKLQNKGDVQWVTDRHVICRQPVAAPVSELNKNWYLMSITYPVPFKNKPNILSLSVFGDQNASDSDPASLNNTSIYIVDFTRTILTVAVLRSGTLPASADSGVCYCVFGEVG